MTNKTLTVTWYCGCNIGPMEWNQSAISGDWVLGQDECDTTFTTQESVVDYEADDCRTECPNCKAVLWQMDSHVIGKEEGK